MRTPQEIATEAQALVAEAAHWSVSIPAEKLNVLTIEFMQSVAAALALPAPIV